MVFATGAFIACTVSERAPRVPKLRMLERFAVQRGPALAELLATVTWLGSLWLLLPLALSLVAAQVAGEHCAKAVRFAAAAIVRIT